MSEVFEIVRNMVSQQSDTDKSEIILDTELRGDLGLDSLDKLPPYTRDFSRELGG